MDGAEFIVDQAIFSSPKTSKERLDTTERRCSSETGEGKQGVNSRQEGGDGVPTLGKKSIPMRERPERAFEKDYGASSSIEKDLREPSPQTAASESVLSSPLLRKPSLRNSHGFLRPGPYQLRRQVASLHPQGASQMDRTGETEAKEDVTWIHQKTGKVMKCRGQQTSRIWEFKPLSAILRPPPSRDAQVSPDSKENKQGRSEGSHAFSEGSKTEHPAPRESCCTDSEPRQPESQKVVRLEEKQLTCEGRYPQDTHELTQQLEEQKLWDQPEKPMGQESAKASMFSSGTNAEVNLIWISPKTGWERRCESQQTSRIWEFKPLSAILQPQEPQKSFALKREVGSRTEGEMAFPGQTKPEGPAAQGSACMVPQLQEEKLQGSTQPQEQPGQFENPYLGCSQQAEKWNHNDEDGQGSPEKPEPFQGQPSKGTDVERELTWINHKTGLEMKCRSQQTRRVWEFKTLSAVLQPSIHEPQESSDLKRGSESGSEEETGFSGGPKTEEPAGSGSACRISVTEALLSSTQVAEPPLQLGSPGSQDFQACSQKAEKQNHKEEDNGQGSPESPETPESSQIQPTHEAVVWRDQTWIIPKTGLEMRCESQQTSRIWEFKPLSKILQSLVQETQESSDLKEVVEGRLDRNIVFPGGTKTEYPVNWGSWCKNLQVHEQEIPSGLKWTKEEPPHPDDQHLQGSQKEMSQEAEEKEPCNHSEQKSELPPEENLSKTDGVQGSPVTPKSFQLQPTNKAIVSEERKWISPRTGLEMKCRSQQTGGVWEPKPLSEILHSSQKSKRVSEMKEEHAQRLLDRGSKTNREMTWSYTEGEDEVQPTYSLISLEEGMMFNNETHRILLSRSQQTDEALFRSAGGTAWGDDEAATCHGKENEEPRVEREQPKEESIQEGNGPGRQRGTSQQQLCAKSEELESDDKDTENIPKGPQLSDEVLFHVESSFVFAAVEEEDLPPIYEKEEDGKEGSFLNTQTGKLLESHCLQTDSFSFQKAEGEAKAF